MNPVIEAMAKQMSDQMWGAALTAHPWGELPENHRDMWREDALAAWNAGVDALSDEQCTQTINAGSRIEVYSAWAGVIRHEPAAFRAELKKLTQENEK